MRSYLEFERPIAELEGKIDDLRALAGDQKVDVADEISRLEGKAEKLLGDTYGHLSRWQKTLVARHAARPHFSDYVEQLTTEFTPLSGDRNFGEDSAIIGGPAFFRGRSVIIMGHEKGSDTQSRVTHNFGMARPEGYRKAIRLVELAEKFGLPIVTLVDTPGAYPGLGAEERGQAEAIASSTAKFLDASVPTVSVIVGEGGSGGAVALAATDKVLMFEHSVYSVISPEGCASILWKGDKDGGKPSDAAEAMKISAQDLLELKVIDEIVPEPLGGAHRHPHDAISNLGDAIARALGAVEDMSSQERRLARREKFLAIGRHGLT
ncbi:acetyl-CoA carboxylase alpha subunit [Parvularcula bermudensis HTCC2503]|uniref:Acetyl-coenzyme A carboxylase carboxyl transferase subunit alpha n=1 Tax=Parvularcula bermudensis (strain ATCC BAA-594 / HTCC2503 / KCTC 12087) TaxID=314260 RepID=E0TDQ6_PARBH|nr:acetyl-CoA carboxylase carboxyltransferase subunit alpha [Parvularcula bermudensis]ADM09972.1 acetyl-CoA carboxylase alpha subunit [Parvularcula bermudensis HTCC2503]